MCGTQLSRIYTYTRRVPCTHISCNTPVHTHTMSWQGEAAFNLCSVVLVYGGTYLIMYRGHSKSAFAKYKFNRRYPGKDLISLEIRRTLVSVFVCCVYEFFILHFRSSEWLQPSTMASTDDNDTWFGAVCIAIGLCIWSDAHFYFVHRLMHGIKVMRRVHMVHHESVNPDPWSGLSFHPAEAVVYFSSMLIACVLPVPYWAFWLHKAALLITPANGHHGHEIVILPCLFNCHHHYLHHAHFNCNYGSPTQFWDWLLGTQCQCQVRESVVSVPHCVAETEKVKKKQSPP